MVGVTESRYFLIIRFVCGVSLIPVNIVFVVDGWTGHKVWDVIKPLTV